MRLFFPRERMRCGKRRNYCGTLNAFRGMKQPLQRPAKTRRSLCGWLHPPYINLVAPLPPCQQYYKLQENHFKSSTDFFSFSPGWKTPHNTFWFEKKKKKKSNIISFTHTEIERPEKIIRVYLMRARAPTSP